ncbi:MAG: polyribonucleotide nucleotidyltransferase [Desulfobacterales bacterium C00003060]|nr:MAG: polyribonucleotide nucleotidyltransferase [Desulfobacterales bacterium S3730MH5]OEU77408.1 MAG: polyribonucleotide nucleotidyltransferase [Desulfobacterales bacterium C00003060]OEU82574.1 MAG: polyribonucleotide nucleotidyltransferase [Desulfobacterales bacterium S5133MH4]
MEMSFEGMVGDRTLCIETGKVARQANGAVLVRYGETIVLVTAVSTDEIREGIDFVPLTVEYQEKGYAAGKIPGNYFRREIGRPGEKATLTARIIDRPIRPLFPKNYRYETQVIATVLSADKENDPDMLAVIGASAALEISDIPFAGPIACVRVGRINGDLRVSPTSEDLAKSDMNLIVAGSRDAVVMVEGGGYFIKEEDILEAIFFGHRALQPIIDLQERLKGAAGRPKRPVPVSEMDATLAKEVEDLTAEGIKKAMFVPEKLKRHNALKGVKANAVATMGDRYAGCEQQINEVFHALERRIIRNLAITEGRRIDGRKFDEVRPIACEIEVLPRTHGSALFTRGETQALGVVTLGSTGDEQRMETLEGDVFIPFMLHYNFLPFSVGEARRFMSPGRREIGHGGLSTRAVEKVLPDRDKFEYTIRIVSEILESNGSSSMATVCASSLALMDAGVPISASVAGIAMGLVKEGDEVLILSDILGDEDHMGDMDFKVAGTREGITSLQMDIKIEGLSKQIMQEALDQARKGRLFILDKMEETIKEPKPEMSPYAPKIFSIHINPDKIRDIIGPGGKVIRAIQAETGTKIDIDDSGLVKVLSVDTESGTKGIELIRDIVQEAEVGAIYMGTVRKIMDFGAFVEIFPGTDGLVHISQLDSKRVNKVTDILKEGDKVRVKVLEVDRAGKIRLSRKAVMEDQKDAE